MLQPYNLTTTIMCDDGQIRVVSIEQYLDGYHAFLLKEDKRYTKNSYTNHVGYPTSREAINAAAKW